MVQKKILMYTTPTCVYCNMAKQFFKEKNIKWEEIDLAKQTDKVDELLEKSGQLGVPVFDIEGEIIIGFDKRAIKTALGIVD